MSVSEIGYLIRSIIADNLDNPDVMEMGDATNLERDLNADDLNMIEIIMDVENEFNIDIQDEEVELLRTIGDFVNYVVEHAEGEGEPPSHENEDTEISSSSIVEFVENGITKKQWNHAWKFANGQYQGMSFFGYSTELCKIKFVSGSWQWDSVTNQSYYTGGQRPQGTQFTKDGYAVNYFNTYSEVEFTSHIDYFNGGQPRATTPKSTYEVISKR